MLALTHSAPLVSSGLYLSNSTFMPSMKGNLTTAVAYYREAIRLCPEFADAHSNLGNVLKVRLTAQSTAIFCKRYR